MNDRAEVGGEENMSHLDILDERKEVIESMLKAMCDPENQPHQWIGDWGLAWDQMFIVTLNR